MSSAACVALNLICARPPGKVNVRTRAGPSGATTAIATVPTGFAAVPPPGPAMPVMPAATSAPVRPRIPSASAIATGSLTAPCASINAGGRTDSGPEAVLVAMLEAYHGTPKSSGEDFTSVLSGVVLGTAPYIEEVRQKMILWGQAPDPFACWLL